MTAARMVARLAEILAQLNPASSDQHQAIEALLMQLADVTGGRDARELAHALAGLNPAPADKRRARTVLLAQLADS
jgi:hypothetical protein